MTLLGWVLLGVYVAGVPVSMMVFAQAFHGARKDINWDSLLGCAVLWPIIVPVATLSAAYGLLIELLVRWIERKLWKHK